MWYENKGKEQAAAVSSRVRIARNLTGYAFPAKLDDEKTAELIGKVRGVFEGKDGWECVDMTSLKPAEKAALFEQHIISREFAERKGPAALIKNEEKSVYIMVPEEDHLRIQCVLPGLDLTEAAARVYEAEEMIDAAHELAFDEHIGYITCCPTNVGTGMRASVMLHLPAYTSAGGIRNLSVQLSKLGMTLRGMNGEGSTPSANLFQISNEATLGLTEEETVSKLNEAVGKIAAKEWELREKTDPQTRETNTDRAMRDIGILLYTNRLNAGELVSMYSDMRQSASMKDIDIPAELLDEMFFSTMPNTLIAENEEARSAPVRDRMRAEKVRGILARAGYKRV